MSTTALSMLTSQTNILLLAQDESSAFRLTELLRFHGINAAVHFRPAATYRVFSEATAFDLVVSGLPLSSYDGLLLFMGLRKRFGHIRFINFADLTPDSRLDDLLADNSTRIVPTSEPERLAVAIRELLGLPRLGIGFFADRPDLLLSLITENMTEVFWVSDRAIQVMFFLSPGYEAIWGRSAASLIENPKTFLDAVHPDDLPEVLQELGKQSCGLPFDHEYRVIRPDGSVRWIRDRGNPVARSDAPVDLYVGLATDITAIKEAEQATRESLKKYRQIVELANEGIWVVDAAACTTFVNPQTANMLGYSIGEMNGRSLTDFMDAESAALAKQKFEARRQGVGETHEFCFRKKNGEGLWTQISAAPIFDEKGQFCGSIAMVTDITERVAVLRAANESRRRLRTLIDTHPAFVLLIRADGTILVCNESFARFVHLRESDAPGMSLWDLIDPEWLGGWRRGVEAIADGKSRVQFLEKHGARRYLTQMFPVTDDQGVAVGELVIGCSDITERTQLESQLVHAQKMEAIGRLAGEIAHDFNNLLMVIRSHLEIAVRNSNATSGAGIHLTAAMDGIRQAGDLTGRLLSFARRPTAEPEVVDVNAAVSEFVQLVAGVLGENIVVRAEPGPGPLSVFLNAGEFRQLLMNLAVNARDAMPSGGSLIIRTSLDDLSPRQPTTLSDSYVRISVQDTGGGMSKEVQSHIFEPFFTTKLPELGTGLGLAIVYGIVKQAGGFIEVTSAPGSGTTFDIWFPADSRQPVAKPEKVPDAAQPHAAAAITVLIVEDNPDLRAVMESWLRSFGYNVLTAGDGRSAERCAAEDSAHIDLLITDLILPDMDGSELARNLMQARQGLKVIYASGYSGREGWLENARREGQVIFRKPFALADLSSKIGEMFSGSPGSSAPIT